METLLICYAWQKQGVLEGGLILFSANSAIIYNIHIQTNIDSLEYPG